MQHVSVSVSALGWGSSGVGPASIQLGFQLGVLLHLVQHLCLLLAQLALQRPMLRL